MKAFNFEIYTKNPQTGEEGWDIVFRTVFVDSKETNSTKSGAREALKNTPLFDCVILFNYCMDINMSDLTPTQLSAINAGYYDSEGYYSESLF